MGPARRSASSIAGQGLERRGALALVILAALACLAAVWAAGAAAAEPRPAAPSCSKPGSGLRPIDQSALQALLDTTADELHVPGAVILLRTPQGEFTATYGTTRLGAP